MGKKGKGQSGTDDFLNQYLPPGTDKKQVKGYMDEYDKSLGSAKKAFNEANSYKKGKDAKY